MEERGTGKGAVQEHSTHVGTFEMPFEPMAWDALELQDTESDSEEDEENEAREEAREEAKEEAEEAKEEAGEEATTGEAGSAASAAAREPPVGTLTRGEDGHYVVAGDGRPVGFNVVGPVAPAGGWRLVDVNGHQPVTESDFPFVARMLARREELMPGAGGGDEGGDGER